MSCFAYWSYWSKDYLFMLSLLKTFNIKSTWQFHTTHFCSSFYIFYQRSDWLCIRFCCCCCFSQCHRHSNVSLSLKSLNLYIFSLKKELFRPEHTTRPHRPAHHSPAQEVACCSPGLFACPGPPILSCFNNYCVQCFSVDIFLTQT